MDLAIAFIIVAGLPGSAEWAIGLLVGINLVARRRVDGRHGARCAQGLIAHRLGGDKPEPVRYMSPP